MSPRPQVLCHQNICKLLQVLETDTKIYMVLEYCPGNTPCTMVNAGGLLVKMVKACLSFRRGAVRLYSGEGQIVGG